MLQLTTQQKLLLAIKPVDFRCGIDSLVGVCKAKLIADPYSGMIFAFTNRKRTAVKLLMYDSNGFWLAMKRFSQGKLAWWPEDNQTMLQVQASALQVLLSQGDPRFMFTPLPWRKHTDDASNTLTPPEQI
jgi:transposase